MYTVDHEIYSCFSRKYPLLCWFHFHPIIVDCILFPLFIFSCFSRKYPLLCDSGDEHGEHDVSDISQAVP